MSKIPSVSDSPEATRIEIKNRFIDVVLFAARAANLREAVILACKSNANLSGADLSGADLSGADLSGAYFFGANLAGTDFHGADLSEADLSGTDLSGVDFSGADLDGTIINWSSHALVSEILRRAIGNDVEKRSFVDLVETNRDWCWPQFAPLSLFGWAAGVLAPYIKNGDNAPKILKDVVANLAESLSAN